MRNQEQTLTGSGSSVRRGDGVTDDSSDLSDLLRRATDAGHAGGKKIIFDSLLQLALGVVSAFIYRDHAG